MAFSLLVNASHNNGGTGTVATTPARDTTGAKIITLVTTQASNNTPTDSASNTWAKRSEALNGSARCSIWECINPTTNASHTFSLTATVPGIAMAAFAGTPDVFDQSNNATGSSVSSLATGSVTPTADNELIIDAALCSSVDPNSIDAGQTLLEHFTGDGATVFGTGLAYEIQTSATTRNPTFTFSGSSGTAGACIATFKQVAAAGGFDRMFQVF